MWQVASDCPHPSRRPGLVPRLVLPLSRLPGSTLLTSRTYSPRSLAERQARASRADSLLESGPPTPPRCLLCVCMSQAGPQRSRLVQRSRPLSFLQPRDHSETYLATRWRRVHNGLPIHVSSSVVTEAQAGHGVARVLVAAASRVCWILAGSGGKASEKAHAERSAGPGSRRPRCLEVIPRSSDTCIACLP